MSGLDWTLVTPGTRLEIGDVRLEITTYTTPCATVAASLPGGEIARIAQKANPGWSRVCSRVLAPGRIRVGDAVLILD